MIDLTREVRFTLAADSTKLRGEVNNSWAGSLATPSLLPYLILRCTISGEPSPTTGYFCNVKRIDELLRHRAVLALIETTNAAERMLDGSMAVRVAWEAIHNQLPEMTQLERLQIKATPFLCYERQRTDSMVRVTQQFEFSASHRLHCEQLSDEENRELFGKCNNVNGHGHNYRVDVTVASPAEIEDDSNVLPPAGHQATPLTQIEAIVKQSIIDRFDHKHLNLDCEEFASLNPTVENIAIVIWELLEPEIRPLKLLGIRVFETPKTWAEYSGPDQDKH